MTPVSSPWAGACLAQDLDRLAAALESAPISVCVNAGTWDDYTGGIISGAACAADAALQDHCTALARAPPELAAP